MKKNTGEFENFIEQKTVEEAWDNINSMIKNSPSADNYMLAANLKIKQQQYGEALNYLFEVLKTDAENTVAKSKISLIYSILNITNNFYYENTYLDDSLYE